MFSTPKFWYEFDIKSYILSRILFPLSLIWIFVDKIRILLANPYRSKITIICVGNLNIGGTGKTPLCIYIYNCLKKIGYNPVFLTAGYKSNVKKPTMVKNNQSNIYFGDEPLLLSKAGPTLISKNRYQGIKYLEKEPRKFDVVIMDDGMQNYQIEKNLQFLAIDRDLLLGNKLCIPAGPLRQPISSIINYIDAIIYTGNKNTEKSGTRLHKNQNENFHTYIEINKKKVNLNKKYLAFSGLANNEKFFNTLKLNNVEVSSKVRFRDHFKYDDKTVGELICKANKNKLSLITTEKDFVKINKKFHKFIDMLPIEIKMDINDTDKFILFLKKRLND